MILAPNRRQPLNGNNWWILAAALLLGTMSLPACNLLKPAQTPTKPAGNDDQLPEISATRIYDPVKGEWIVVQTGPLEKMDTIRFAEISATRLPPIASDDVRNAFPPVVTAKPNPNTAFPPGQAYKVAVMLPFIADRASSGGQTIDNTVSRWAINFFGGLKLGLQELSAEGINLETSVMDTKADPLTMSGLLSRNQDVANAQVIIGPYRRDNVRLAADYVRDKGKVLLSPYSAVGGLTTNNPNYLQVSPSLESHCEALLEDALRDFDPDQVVLVSRDVAAELNCIDHLQRTHLTIAGGRDALPLDHLQVKEGRGSYAAIPVADFMQGKDQVAFIVTSWAEEIFIYSLLQKIDQSRAPDQEIVIYGLPPWMDFERIDYTLLEKLNVRVSSTNFLDLQSPAVLDFRRKFYDQYGTIPAMEAYQGYDLVRYCGRMLQRYGPQFQQYVDSELTSESFLATRYEFEKIVEATTTGAENLPVQRLENKGVFILQFKDFQFKPLR